MHPPWVPILTASSDPDYLPETHLQIPPLRGLAFQHVNFEGTQTFSPKHLILCSGTKNAQLQTPRAQVALMVKNLPASAGDRRDMRSIPGSGRSLREGHGNPLQYSCLENSMDREVWWATVYGVTKSRTWLKWLSSALQTARSNPGLQTHH